MISPAIETTALSREFRGFQAVEGLNLTVERGQFFGFLGPNGAGKSTTIKMLAGLLAPSSGIIRIFGEDLLTCPVEVSDKLGSSRRTWRSLES